MYKRQGRGTASMATPLIFSVTVLYGPAIGMWMAALGTLRKRDLSLEVPISVVLFNRGMLTICAYVFSRIYFLSLIHIYLFIGLAEGEAVPGSENSKG